MSKPILFLFSSTPPLENIYFLKDVGSVINLNEAPEDLVMQYEKKDFLICNMQDPKQVDKMKYINLDNTTSVAVLRSYESIDEPWLQRLKPVYKVKSFDFVDKCKTKDEIINYIKIKSVYKKPDRDIVFYIKKLAFLWKCIFGGDS